MTKDVLIIDYDPFNMESRMYVMRDGKNEDKYTVESNIPELSETAVRYAKETGVYNLRIRGPWAIVHEIKRSIAEAEMRTYSENKITVEGL